MLLIHGTLLAQEPALYHESDVPSHDAKDIADVPDQETEDERAEAKQTAAKGEALKAIFVHGQYTYIPLPVFAYARNESYWVGAIVPILSSNAKGDLTHIIAPQYLHNPNIGETVTLNYFGYPSDNEQYNLVATYSTKIQRNIELNYKNVAAGGGRYILAGQVQWFTNPFRRFFGLGNRSLEMDETIYTSDEALAHFTAGINLDTDFALLWSERFHYETVQGETVTSLKRTADVYPSLIGINGAQVVGHKLALRYDTRDKQLVTTQGTYVYASAELNQNLMHHGPNRWFRTVFDARHFIPHYDNQMVFVSRVFADSVIGNGVPFYELPSLGGETTLRAFGQGRFIDNNAFVVSFEERIRVGRKQIMEYNVDLEIAPFLDIGRVMNKLSLRDLARPEINEGVGVRIITQPYVVGRLDLGHGKDGLNVFVGLDYPF